jgi:Raf kinase inhibitor-like YbhB/YbcL family protein
VPRSLGIVAVAVAVATAGCGAAAAVHHTRPRTPAPASITLSSGFSPGSAIPRAYTCDGQDLSPPLRASGLPAATVELLVVMDDHDAPGGSFIHWAIAHINPRLVAGGPPGSASLQVARNPSGAVLGRNSFGSLGYRGPCPPPGDAPHHYEITVYALGQPSRLSTGFSAGTLGKLDVLALGTLSGTYARR